MIIALIKLFWNSFEICEDGNNFTLKLNVSLLFSYSCYLALSSNLKPQKECLTELENWQFDGKFICCLEGGLGPQAFMYPSVVEMRSKYAFRTRGVWFCEKKSL